MARRNRKRKRSDTMESPQTSSAPTKKTAPCLSASDRPPRETRSLLSLPAEIRVNIYKSLFKDSEIEVCPSEKYISAPTSKNSLPILLTCRLIHEEAQPVLVRQTAMVILESCRKSDLPKSIRRSYLPHIQSLVLTDLGVNFRLKHVPNVKKITILDEGATTGVRSVLKHSRLTSSLPYLHGALDKQLARKWMRAMDEVANSYSHISSTKEEGVYKMWNRIKKLKESVQVIRKGYVSFDLLYTETGKTMWRSRYLDFDCRTAEVFNRSALGSRKPQDDQRLLELLTKQLDHNDDGDDSSDDWSDVDDDSSADASSEESGASDYDDYGYIGNDLLPMNSWAHGGVPFDALPEGLQDHMYSMYY